MMPLAALVGRFIGAVLAECGPVLAEIVAHGVRKAFENTVETGFAPTALRERLLERVRNAHNPGAVRKSGATPDDDQKR